MAEIGRELQKCPTCGIQAERQSASRVLLCLFYSPHATYKFEQTYLDFCGADHLGEWLEYHFAGRLIGDLIRSSSNIELPRWQTASIACSFCKKVTDSSIDVYILSRSFNLKAATLCGPSCEEFETILSWLQDTTQIQVEDPITVEVINRLTTGPKGCA